MLEGTSLFSEATSLVLFNLFLGLMNKADGQQLNAGQEMAKVLQVILGGPAWGRYVTLRFIFFCLFI